MTQGKVSLQMPVPEGLGIDFQPGGQGEREELSPGKAERLKRQRHVCGDKKLSVCCEHSEKHLETEEALQDEEPPDLQSKL